MLHMLLHAENAGCMLPTGGMLGACLLQEKGIVNQSQSKPAVGIVIPVVTMLQLSDLGRSVALCMLPIQS